jgi:hypothetical protein
MIKKKAQGMPITVIIIAVLALLVLVILALVFTGGLSKWLTKTSDCENKGGMCAFTCGSAAEGTEEFPTEYSEWTCPDKDTQPQKCCVKIAAP